MESTEGGKRHDDARGHGGQWRTEDGEGREHKSTNPINQSTHGNAHGLAEGAAIEKSEMQEERIPRLFVDLSASVLPRKYQPDYVSRWGNVTWDNMTNPSF